MRVVALLTCQILESEVAHLLAGDADVARITVVGDETSQRLVELLTNLKRDPYVIPHVSAFAVEPGSGLEVVVRVLPMALHRHRAVLRSAVSRAAAALRHYVDAYLLAYGQCGGALGNAQRVLDVQCALFQPMDGDQVVDDCVGLSLGGRTRYREEQLRVPGTFFMTPGWARHWRELFGNVAGSREVDAAKRLFRRYERSLVVRIPELDSDSMRQGEDFCREFGVRLETCAGSTVLLQAAWGRAKAAALGKRTESVGGQR